MDSYTKLAKNAVETYIKTGRIITPPSDLPPDMNRSAGIFVSIHTKDGKLRGCIGMIQPFGKTIAELIIENAISAAVQDPRFFPVTEDELPFLVYKVDVLSVPKPVKNKKELNPKKYGVIVSTDDGRQGLLLPDLEGVESVDQQLDIACQKAGILKGEEYKIFKFTVERHQ
jgi:AmmeMemoRadiSam system protein A